MFSSEDDALEFLEDYDLGDARAEMLKESGRVLESAGVHAGEGDVLKAVETLTASTVHNIDHARPTIEYLLTGLRRGLTLGAPLPPTPVVSKLLELVDRLDRSVMTEREINEVSHPIHSTGGRWSVILHPSTPARNV